PPSGEPGVQRLATTNRAHQGVVHEAQRPAVLRWVERYFASDGWTERLQRGQEFVVLAECSKRRTGHGHCGPHPGLLQLRSHIQDGWHLGQRESTSNLRHVYYRYRRQSQHWRLAHPVLAQRHLNRRLLGLRTEDVFCQHRREVHHVREVARQLIKSASS